MTGAFAARQRRTSYGILRLIQTRSISLSDEGAILFGGTLFEAAHQAVYDSLVLIGADDGDLPEFSVRGKLLCARVRSYCIGRSSPARALFNSSSSNLVRSAGGQAEFQRTCPP